MSDDNTMQSEETFAAGRYSKRKRKQITYTLDEREVSDSDSDSESPQSKKRKAHALSEPLPVRKIFPFLDLPAELRNMIYTYALINPAGFMLAGTHKHKRRTVKHVSAVVMMKISGSSWSSAQMNDGVKANNTEPVTLSSSLLATNKQINKEAHTMFYGNEFVFADSFALYCFLINIGPANCKYLKTIRILGWGGGRAKRVYNHACFTALTGATNMTAFHIEARIKWQTGNDHGAEQLYRDAFPWMEAMGAAAGKADAVVDVLHFSKECFTLKLLGYTILPWRKSYQQCVDETKTALRKLLKEQQKRMMGSPDKKRKTLKGAIADEL